MTEMKGMLSTDTAKYSDHLVSEGRSESKREQCYCWDAAKTVAIQLRTTEKQGP